MSLYNGPARGGNRGGKDAFNWDQVKSESPVTRSKLLVGVARLLTLCVCVQMTPTGTTTLDTASKQLWGAGRMVRGCDSGAGTSCLILKSLQLS